jgi:hypothetical protein
VAGEAPEVLALAPSGRAIQGGIVRHLLDQDALTGGPTLRTFTGIRRKTSSKRDQSSADRLAWPALVTS